VRLNTQSSEKCEICFLREETKARRPHAIFSRPTG
jgi:hypothetical protein